MSATESMATSTSVCPAASICSYVKLPVKIKINAELLKNVGENEGIICLDRPLRDVVVAALSPPRMQLARITLFCDISTTNQQVNTKL